MNKLKLFLTALIVPVMIATSVAAEGNRADTFTISPLIGGYSFDDRQNLDTPQPLYGFRAGYNFSKHFGVEALFDYALTFGTQPNMSDVHMYRYGADFLLHLFPDNKLVPYLAAGYSGMTLDFEKHTPRGDAHFHANKGIGDYGAGIKYFLTDNLALRSDFRQLLFSDGGALINYEYTAGITFQFGGKKPAQALIAAPETAERQPPQPAPETVAAPMAVEQPAAAAVKEAPLEPLPAAEPAPGHYKYCVTLHTEFDIDKTDIRPEYHHEVAKVGDFMKKFPTTTAVIEGHSDNVGAVAHNIELSRRRAESVVNYLVQNFGIERSRLTATAYGPNRPVADNSTEAGKQKNRRIEAIIDCAFDVKEVKPPEQLCMLLQVEFEPGRADTHPRYHDEIARVGEYMRKYPATTAVIEGHTDNSGSHEHNMRLSQQRAESVVNYLVENFGIERSRLTAKGYGSNRQIAYNSTPEGRRKNRRINAIIDCVVK